MRSKKGVKALAIGNFLGYILTILVNYLANTLPINGKTTGELSGQYPNLFTPAAFTFSIWGLIYILLGIFCFYGLWSAFKETKGTLLIGALGFSFMISCLANISWILAWHYEKLGLSVAVMVILLASLIQAYLSLKIQYQKKPPIGTYLAWIPISVYLGWISVATIANVTTYLVSIGWNGFGLPEAFWAVTLIGVSTLLGFIMMFQREDIYFALVIVWALYGILVKRLTADVRVESVIWAALLGIILLTINVVYITLNKKRSRSR